MRNSNYKLIPEFVLKDEEKKDFSWQNLLGKYSVVYFYPKANTPGCTLEGIDFSRLIDEFNGNVVGISPDDCKAITSFKSKKGLKVKLLSDPEKEVARAFGATDGEKLVRSTFIIDPWGRIRKEWIKVSVKGHAEQVLNEYKKIIASDLELNENISFRRAFRAVKSDPISDEEIKTLIRAAHLAPSCANKQPWRFVIVRNEEKLKKLHEALSDGNYWMKYAPAIIVVHTKDELDCQLSDNRNYALYDTGTAVGFLVVQATQMGLIAHPIAGFEPLKVKELLNIEGTVITLIAVGRWGNFDILNDKHLQIEKSERRRVDLEEIYRFDS
ncbi:MAG: glutaredoxin-dependent peroxiredoxin [Thermotogaceae bacterium]|jgi:peroxiredoxin|nr:glutaredoxin-dependent peroxiredoxin [Thermotogaceae bacterium]MDN5337347.1 glutaredoxin-dependent peroxiredoxin [Thermotogaceae bacterium]